MIWATHASVSEKEDPFLVPASLEGSDRLDWLQNIGTSVICTVGGDLMKYFLQHLVVVWLHLMGPHKVGETRPKTDDLEHAALWQTLEEKLKSLQSLIDSASAHRSTSVYNENKAELALTRLVD